MTENMRGDKDFEFEAALKFYEVTRAALVARVTLRDNSIMFYIAGIAALAGATLQSGKLIYLMVIPLVSLGVAGIVAHHNKIILGYILYLTDELQPSFNRLGISAVQWDLSRAGIGNKNVGMRYFSDVAYISIPSVVAVVLNVKAGWPLLLLACTCSVLSAYFLATSYRFHMSVDMKLTAKKAMEDSDDDV